MFKIILAFLLFCTTANADNSSFLLTNVSVGTGSPNQVMTYNSSTTTTGTSSLVVVSGNVGVGNPSPSQTLDVNGTARTAGLIDLGVSANSLLYNNGSQSLSPVTIGSGLNFSSGILSSNATGYTSITQDANGNIGINSTVPHANLTILSTNGYDPLHVGENGVSVLKVTATGNVGVGSSSPGQVMDVNGTVRSTNIIDTGVTASKIVKTSAGQQFTAATGDTDYQNPITLTTTGSSGAATFSGDVLNIPQYSGGGSSQWTTINTNDVYLPNQGNVGIGTSNTATSSFKILKNGSIDYIRINSLPAAGGDVFLVQNSGNVGIGSTAPGQILDVGGTVRGLNFSGPLTGNVTGNVTGSSGSTTGNAATATALQTGRTINGTTFDGTSNITTTAAAGTLTGTTLNPTVVNSSLTSVGNLTANVGIGSAIPGQALDVNGTVRATNFSGAGTGLTGTASSLTANTVTTNANLTGAITSVGNASSITAPSGNTTTIVTATGTLPSGHYVKWDANGNAIDGGTGSGSTSAGGGQNAVQYNSGSGTFAGAENILSFNGTNVGIGTTNGRNLLDVKGTVTTTSLEIQPSGNIGIGTLSPGTLLGVGSTNAFAITAGGTVSINNAQNNTFTGTSSGNTLLALTNSSQTTGHGLTMVSGASGATSYLGLYQYTNSGASGPVLQLSNAGSGPSLYVSSGNVGIGTATPGNLLDVKGTIRMTLGFGLAIVTGSNAKMGTGTLSGGTVTISTNVVKSNSLIFITDTGGGVAANIGTLEVGTITANTSFVVNSSNVLDSSNFNWIIIDQS